MKANMRKGLAALALLLGGAAQATVQANMQSQTMSSEAAVLMHSGKVNEALALHQRAIKADPGASAPVSWLAEFYLWVSARVKPEEQPHYRKLAEANANRALELDDADPVAHEVLRSLDEAGLTVLHEPSDAAHKLLIEGETLFQQAKYEAALAKFDASFAADPAYSAAQVLAGDCFYARAQWAPAEARFRRAAEVEPLNAQAWRFLSDALAQQGKLDEARVALINSLAAHPGQQPSWNKWAGYMGAQDKALQALSLRIKAHFERDPQGKPTITLAESLKKEDKPYNSSFWLGYALSKAGAQDGAPPFQTELAAWRDAFKVLDEVDAKQAAGTLEPAVAQMRTLHKEGQLEAALYLLAYKEKYRAEFEAWKRNKPKAVAEFLDKYRLRP